MLFSSLIFIFLFLPIVIFVYYVLLRGYRKAQNVFLLLASLGFYAWGEPKFVFVMIGSIVGNWGFGILIDKYRGMKAKEKTIIVAMLIFNLGIIFIFKYLMFTLNNINRFFHTELYVPNIFLPIGISFFTFQAISYVIDVYRNNASVQNSLLNVGLYISFFPQLIAGPIVRYQTIAEQITNRQENYEDFSKGVCRFITGLGKKVLLANNLALVADKAFSLGSAELTVSFAWLGAVAYSLQLFFDFSGYSDMAIGLGKMFGFHFLENFDYPYTAKSVSEFWRRWHISLGSWFRDYVYFPLGGSRVKSRSRLIINLFIVWFLTGLWHGANWTFILWGLYYFLLILVEKLLKLNENNKIMLRMPIISHIYAIVAAVFGWVLFRAENLSQASTYIKAMLGISKTSLFNEYTLFYLNETLVFLLFAIIFSMPIGKKISEAYGKTAMASLLYSSMLILIFILCVAYLVKGSYNPFIYFNF